LKICVIGPGSIGKRHIRILYEHFGICPLVADRNTSPTGIDVAVICTPTDTHIPIAIEYAKKGAALFIEKPLSNSLDGLDELNRIVNIKGLPTYVAYPLRFYDFIWNNKNEIESLMCLTNASNWPSKRQLDHVLLELSHELDIAYWKSPGELSGKVIGNHAFYGKLGDTFITLDMNTEYEVRYATTWYGYYDLKVTDELYRKQWAWFLNNMHYGMMNNIRRARPLLEMILKLTIRPCTFSIKS